MSHTNKSKGTGVTGVIGEDVHVVGIRILEYALGEAGFKVVPLGSQVSQKEFVDAATETSADAILVSSLSEVGVVKMQLDVDHGSGEHLGSKLNYARNQIEVPSISYDLPGPRSLVGEMPTQVGQVAYSVQRISDFRLQA